MVEDDFIPQEPSADARQMARVFRDFYIAFTDEGFTEDQALKMLGNMIASAHQANKESDE